jgi:hypothetical protein
MIWERWLEIGILYIHKALGLRIIITTKVYLKSLLKH